MDIAEDVKEIIKNINGISFEDKAVLVTGGAGFLGSWICEVLVEQDAKVICVDNLSSGLESNISHLLNRENFRFIKYDVSKPLNLNEEKIDAIMHLASRASPLEFDKYPIEIIRANTLGTMNMLELARKYDARFLFASTSEVYGDAKVIPTPETYYGNVNPVGVRGCYDESKRCGEALCMAYLRQYDVDVRIARIFNSILEGEPVVIFNDGELHICPIEDCLNKKRIHVPCFNPKNYKMEIREVDFIIKHEYNKDAYEIETTYGRKVKVTGDHSVFTFRNGKLEPIPVRMLKVGDYIAIPSKLPVIEKDVKEINIAKEFIKNLSDKELWYFSLFHESFGGLIYNRRDEIYRILVESGHFKARDKRSIWGSVLRFIKNSYLPLYVVKKLEIEIPRGCRIGTYGGGKRPKIPNNVEITNDLLWLLGLYLAEGSCAYLKNKSYSITISSDEYLVKKAKEILERSFNVHVTYQESRGNKAPAIYVHSKVIYYLFNKVFKVKNRIPSWVFQLPLSRLKYFLEGYKDGDGTHKGKYVGKMLDFNTSNEKLALDLMYLLLRFCVVAMVKKCKTRFNGKTFEFYRISIRGLDNYNILDWDKGVKQKLMCKRVGDIVLAKIKKIRKIRASKIVYDFSVPEYENFLAGWGVCCHNTYGPRMRADSVYGRVVPRFIKQALNNEPITIFGDGKQTRSFCYVTDQIEGLLRLAWFDECKGEIVNIGKPDEITILELAEVIKKITNSESPIEFYSPQPDDPRRRCPDISKARELLKWEPKVELERGLTKLVGWFRVAMEKRGRER